METNKRLLLVRHAKSDWHRTVSDFDRPLNSRGERNAADMARRLQEKKLIPQQLLSSPAKRALTTASYFANALGLPEIAIEETIYEASLSTLLRVVNNLENKYDFIALFGHNPGISELNVSLCDSDIVHLPTCGMVLIEFPFDDWKLVAKGTGDLKLYDYPKSRES